MVLAIYHANNNPQQSTVNFPMQTKQLYKATGRTQGGCQSDNGADDPGGDLGTEES